MLTTGNFFLVVNISMAFFLTNIKLTCLELGTSETRQSNFTSDFAFSFVHSIYEHFHAFNTKPAFFEVNYIKNSVFCLIYLMRNVCFACAYSYLASGNFKVPGVLIMKIQKHVKTKKNHFLFIVLLLAFS